MCISEYDTLIDVEEIPQDICKDSEHARLLI